MALATTLYALALTCSAAFAVTLTRANPGTGIPFIGWPERRTRISVAFYFLTLTSGVTAPAAAHRYIGLGRAYALGLLCMLLPQFLITLRHNRRVGQAD